MKFKKKIVKNIQKLSDIMKGKEFLELSVFLFAFRQQKTHSKASKTARAHLHIPIMSSLGKQGK